MDYRDPKLHLLLKELLAGREIGELVDDCLSRQVRLVAWNFLRNGENANDLGVSQSRNNSESHMCPEGTTGLREIFAETAIQIRLESNHVGIDIQRPEGELAVGLLGEILSQTVCVMTRQLCNILSTPLIMTVAKLHNIPSSHYFTGKYIAGLDRAAGFVDRSGIEYICDISLSGDRLSAPADRSLRDVSNIVVVTSPSELMRQQLHLLRKHWIDLGAQDGYKRIHTVFNYLDIPCADFTGDLDTALDRIIPQVFAEIA